MRSKLHFARSATRLPLRSRKMIVAFSATALTCAGLIGTQVSVATGDPAGSPSAPANVPYTLPVTNLPSQATSPAVAADAPYTPAVMNIIAQLEPDNPPTLAELTNASKFFYGGTVSGCRGVGSVAAPTLTASASVPSLMPQCWADAQGINLTGGSTTGPADLMGLGATFDRNIANVWGQTEATEGREEMITGLNGPQVDVARIPMWGRNLTSTGADPFLNGQLASAEVNGIQAGGLLSQVKHFAAYNGGSFVTPATLQDQALHQVYLTPYESAFVGGGAGAAMCSYQLFQDTSTTLPGPVSSLASTYPVSPYGASSQKTWPLNELHQACEQPLTMTYALRDLWGSKAMVGTDYRFAEYSASGINQGEDQEMPNANAFSASNTPGVGALSVTGSTNDQTGDTCIDSNGNGEPCSTAGATHIPGIPGANCPKTTGCSLVQAVYYGYEPLSVFNQDLATQIYQEQRLGMLGCNQTPVLSTCTNPGGQGTNQTGTLPLPNGPSTGATPAANLGTASGDAAVVERESEEAGTLLKNDNSTLPITQSDLNHGVLVTGATSQYLIADPTSEASTGFPARDLISPLQQLETLSGDPSGITYNPALDPVGEPVPSTALSTSNSSVNGHLSLTSTTSGGTTTSNVSSLDDTAVSSSGQLQPGNDTWSGYLYVPNTDTYNLDFQVTNALAAPTAGVITGQSWAAGTATLTVAKGTAPAVGAQFSVTGACAAGYDGTFTATASGSTSVSYALATNPGACSPANINIAGASYAPGFAIGPFALNSDTVTLNIPQTNPLPSVGSNITVTGVTPAAYNGTFKVTATTPTSISYTVTAFPGTYVSGGTIAPTESGAIVYGALQVSFNGAPVPLTTTAAVNTTGNAVASSPTVAGYTEAGLRNVTYAAGSLTGGKYYPITITLNNSTTSPASLRFGYSRVLGDAQDAAAAAKGKSMAIVFLDDTGGASEFGPTGSGPLSSSDQIPNPYYDSSKPITDSNPPYIAAPESLPANQTALVKAVAAANPNTVVVLNTSNPIEMPWVGSVKSVLEMWYAGQEGGTATARLLLGQANPSGHLPITFPANGTDTIWGYNEKTPLYAGDTTGPHLERLNGDGGCFAGGCPADSTTQETEGIYNDYRFFDKEGINPLFPFGWGLSYSTFSYSGLHVSPASDGGLNVRFRVSNTSNVAGVATPQVYLGAPAEQPSGIQFAVRQLAQFERVSLNGHESELVTEHVGLRQLQYWDSTSQKWLVATGPRTVYVGDGDAVKAPVGDPNAGDALSLNQTINVSDNSHADNASSSGQEHSAGHGKHASTMTCTDEQLSATVISGDLSVPSGQWCDILDTTVKGSIRIGASAGVRIEESTVAGNIIASNNSQAADPLSAGSNVICDNTVGGDIVISGSGTGAPWNLGLCGANTVQGSIGFYDNQATGNSIAGNNVGGNLTCVGNGAVTASGNTVKGSSSGQCGSDPIPKGSYPYNGWEASDGGDRGHVSKHGQK